MEYHHNFHFTSRRLRYAMPDGDFSSVLPAQLAFLAIYNPLVASNHDSISDQIVFYTSRSTRLRRFGAASGEGDVEETKNEENRRMRQIGLAQAMVTFAKYDLLVCRNDFTDRYQKLLGWKPRRFCRNR